MKERKMAKPAKDQKKNGVKKTFIKPEVVEERDFAGVVAVTLTQSLSNILPKTFKP
ncbi:MAG TPA: hypothetical protein VII00_04305 [bacterium]